MNIQLTCSLCGGKVLYEHKTASEQDKAHAQLHKEGCAWAACKERLDFMAEHGAPVESEVVSNEV